MCWPAMVSSSTLQGGARYCESGLGQGIAALVLQH